MKMFESLGCMLLLAVCGCSGAKGDPARGTVGNGGASSGASGLGFAGASMSSFGGASAAGGANSSGGMNSFGGANSAGGANSSGGTNASGGASGSAGSSGGGGTAGGPPVGVDCEQSFTDTDTSLPGCIAEVGGITFKFLPLASGKAVKRLAVYMHADTAVDWNSDSLFSGVAAWMAARDILVTAPLSPVAYDGDPPSSRSFGAAQNSDARKVGAALESFAAAFDAPTNHILYYSMSGGSWFLTSSFIPLMGGRLPGLFAMSCGASEFWADYAWDEKAASPRDQIKLFFNYGTADFLLAGEEGSVAKYKGDGFTVTEKTYPGAQHCEHPVIEPTLTFWEANL